MNPIVKLASERRDSNDPYVVHELVGLNSGVEQKSVAFIEIAPGQSSSHHFHNERVESYFIVSGKAKVLAGDKTYSLKQGDFIYLPVLIAHKITNDGPQRLKFLAHCAPSWTPSDEIIEKP